MNKDQKSKPKADLKAAPRVQNGAAGTTVAPSSRATEPPPSPELMAKIVEMRSKIQLSVGQLVIAIMDLPRYKHISLADLTQTVIQPLLRNRIAIAHKSSAGGKVDEETIAGIAIWASVSDAVDLKIAEQIKAGVFPVRLAAEEWASGDHHWLLDVIAGDRAQATSVLANFRQIAGDKQIKIHPLVGRLIDPQVLEKLRLASAPPGGATA